MVVSFDVDSGGTMSGVEVAAAVIKSKARLTYDQVAGHLSGEVPLDDEVGARVELLRAAADRLRSNRLGRGAVELHLPETKVILDEDDRERVRDVVQARQDPEMKRAYNLIEELMVAANEGVGHLAVEHRLPVVYRVHDRPDEARVERSTARQRPARRSNTGHLHRRVRAGAQACARSGASSHALLTSYHIELRHIRHVTAIFTTRSTVFVFSASGPYLEQYL